MDSGKPTSKYVKGSAVFVVLLATLGLVRLTYQPLPPEDEDPTYSMTVWIEPTNYTFYLHIDFFLHPSDTGDIDKRYGGHSFVVDPWDDPRNEGHIRRLPSGLDTVWVDVYVNETAKTTSSLTISQKKTIGIPDHVVEILVVPWTGQ